MKFEHAHTNCEIKRQCPKCKMLFCIHYDRDNCQPCNIASLARLIAKTLDISVKQLYRLEKQGAIKMYHKDLR